jgi:pentatricopeptide repeat protein
VYSRISSSSSPSLESSPWIHKASNFTLYGSFHASSVETQVSANDASQDAERICKILTKFTDSKVETLLNEASVKLSPALIEEVLKKLSNAGVLALSVFKWAENQKGFKHTTSNYNALIESLGKIKQFKLIWSLVDDMKAKKLLSKETFALISRRYARARKVKEAIGAFHKMEEFGFKMESSDFNRMLDTLSKSRNVGDAQKVFDKMKKKRFEPDIKSYTILLEGWGQELNLLTIIEINGEMKISCRNN